MKAAVVRQVTAGVDDDTTVSFFNKELAEEGDAGGEAFFAAVAEVMRRSLSSKHCSATGIFATTSTRRPAATRAPAMDAKVLVLPHLKWVNQ